MKSSIQRTIVTRIKTHFTTTGFILENTQRLVNTSHRVLRSTIWEFQTQFQQVLNEKQEVMHGLQEEKNGADEATEFFFKSLKTSEGLQSQLNKVHLE